MAACNNYVIITEISERSIVIIQVTVSVVAMWVTVPSNNSILLSQLSHSFHKIDQKTFECIISGLHFSTFVNIRPKLRSFEGRNYIQIGLKNHSVLIFPKGL